MGRSFSTFGDQNALREPLTGKIADFVLSHACFILSRLPARTTLKITSVSSVECASGWDISVHRAGHVFESRSRIGRIPLIAHLTPQLPKVRQHRQKNWTIFRLTAFTIPKLGAFPMLILIVVLVHLLEIFYCKTFLLRHVQNLDFCFPVLVFLLKTMGF